MGRDHYQIDLAAVLITFCENHTYNPKELEYNKLSKKDNRQCQQQ